MLILTNLTGPLTNGLYTKGQRYHHLMGRQVLWSEQDSAENVLWHCGDICIFYAVVCRGSGFTEETKQAGQESQLGPPGPLSGYLRGGGSKLMLAKLQ